MSYYVLLKFEQTKLETETRLKVDLCGVYTDKELGLSDYALLNDQNTSNLISFMLLTKIPVQSVTQTVDDGSISIPVLDTTPVLDTETKEELLNASNG